MARSVALILAAAFAVAACGSNQDSRTPAACLADPPAYLAALADAPGGVRLEGSTPISDCIVPEQDAGPLAAVGGSMVTAATRLNRRLRSDFDRDDAVRLGYLVGAVEGAAVETGGIHEDLVLRLNSAARFGGGDAALGARFERAFGAGHAAGRERG